jgi:cell fate regulator YaaT (PSP1 superfamily)
MGCIGCSCSTGKDTTSGCRSNGGCSTGGCNRHNTYDWISAIGIQDTQPFDVVEVSFKNGSRKEFFKNPGHSRAMTGDWVLVESPSGGYDVGTITLSGELVRMQMKRKRVRNDAKQQTVIRKAHDRDLERLDELRKQERDLMIRARAIARTLDLNMKVGDVEFQGDGRKCTFYYTADGRVDFRELIRHYAREFKVKIEMRQIGARQESARIGGLGNCGRELCCSTWLTEFKSVNTAAARYQNLAINQTKLSGMCGRLKCCLNYELDTYIDALEDFPDKAERIKTRAGLAILIKTDVFKRLMFYTYAEDRGKFYSLHVDQVWEALDLIKQGELPASLDDILAMAPPPQVIEETEEDEQHDYESVDNVIQLPMEKRKKKRKKKRTGRADETLASAVEKAGQDERARSPQRRGDQRPGGGNRSERPQQQRPDNRQGRPENRSERPPRPENRPERTPENRQERPPRPENRPERTPENRSERPPRPENRPERTPENRQERPPRPENRPERPPQQPPAPPKKEGDGETPTQNPADGNTGGGNRGRDKRRFRGKGPRGGDK